MYFKILALLFIFANFVQADLRSWALGVGKGGGGIAVPAPNSASTYGKSYKTCSVQGISRGSHVHASLWFAPECSGSGYWRLQYNTDWGVCVMFGDESTTGCPFPSLWTSSAQVKIVNKGTPTTEYTSPEGITFMNCRTGARVELSRNEDRYCSKDAPAENCKTMTAGSIFSFLCPNK